MGMTPRVKSYRVSGVFEIGMSEYDASIIYMPLAEAQAYFNADGIVQSIELSCRTRTRLMSFDQRSKKPQGGKCF